MRFSREPLTPALLTELEPLLRAHFEEVIPFGEPFAPNYEKYLQAHDAGIYHFFTVRDDDTGSLVGYAAFFVSENPQSKGSKHAKQDLLYVSPRLRGRILGTGRKLIEFVDRCLGDEGVQFVHQHVSARHNFAPLLEELGYEFTEATYSKNLTRRRS